MSFLRPDLTMVGKALVIIGLVALFGGFAALLYGEFAPSVGYQGVLDRGIGSAGILAMGLGVLCFVPLVARDPWQAATRSAESPEALLRAAAKELGVVALNLVCYVGAALVALGALTALDRAPIAAGLVMIACYDACSMVFLLYIVDSARRLDLSTYILSAAYLGGSALSLLTGLGVGSILRSLSVDYGLSLLTLLAFAAIYPLAGVLVFGISKARRQLGPRTSDSEEDSVTDCTHPADTPMPDEVSEGEANASDSNSIDNAFEGGVEGIAAASGLTRREREILGYLARGRSARYIAEDLVLSENTVWAHIKRIYSKTGVHTKQELMSIVEKMAEGKE